MTTLTLDDSRLYTIDEAAEVLRCTSSWLRGQVTANTVPSLRLGKRKGVRFTAGDLVEITSSRHGKPAQENLVAEIDPLAAFSELRSLRSLR
jgi:hypothetical protein